MSKTSLGPIALIVDDDPGFVCWLGEMFHVSGYRPFPALSTCQAVSFVKEFDLKVAIVIVNPNLADVGSLIKVLSHPDNPSPLKIIAIREPTASDIRAHAILERPSGGELASRHEWLRKLRMVLEQAEEAAAIAKNFSLERRE